MTGDDPKRPPRPGPASIAPSSPELDGIDSSWSVPADALKPQHTASESQRALASTLPPPRVIPAAGLTAVHIGFLDNSGASALELADLHAVRNPSLVAMKLMAEPVRAAPVAIDSIDYMRMLKDKMAMGDFTGALALATGILETEPHNPEAQRYTIHCENVLTQMYTARLGSLSQVVSVQVAAAQVRWLSLDHRAGFLLSLVDGQLTLEQLLDISGMPRLEALRLLHGLYEQQIISVS